MLKLVKPSLEYKEKYKEMINEWKNYGGPFEPCIIEYDCTNPAEELDYNAVIDVVNNYSKGNIYDYDKDYFLSSDFYFIIDENELIGMCELRHNLLALGKEIKGNINCGIRPSKRNKGYCQNTIKELINIFRNKYGNIIYMCFDEGNTIMSKIANKFDFKYKKTTQTENKNILSYNKKIL